MAIDPGTRIGPYQIVSPIGAGGMGEVYRARDTQLKREVAIKVLPAAFAADADRLARFRREAELLAALNHPHIAAVHGLEKTASGIAIVLELVDGDTLAERVARGPLPVDDTLAIARQVAEALEAAHEKGIVHRDLKPANVKITPDGRVKVLDFGLAKLQADDGAASSPGLSFSPTITSPAGTFAGVLLGTAAYMSPEQAKGQAVDRRTDIFAFGCLLFEMLTGRPAFAGSSIAEILAAVLKSEPDWSALPADTPPALQRLLRRCLQKDRQQRLQSAGDARIELDEIRIAPSEPGPATVTMSRPARSWWLWTWAAIATLLFVGAAVPLARILFVPKPAPMEMRLEIAAPPTTELMSFAVSPDGRHMVSAATASAESGLWLRTLAAPGGRLLPGTDGATYPFWSPDSKSIGFFADSKLKRVDLDGGAARILADVLVPRGGAWGADGIILFAPHPSSPLMRVQDDGGPPATATRLSAGQTDHRFPAFLPDGRHFLYFAQGVEKEQGIYLASVDSPQGTLLTTSDTSGLYHPDGWVMYARQNALIARRLDVEARTLTGAPHTVADAVSNDVGIHATAASIARTGLIAYRPGGASVRQLAWFDRTGQAQGTLGTPDENNLANVEISPDGTRVVADRMLQGNTDVWILDGVRATRLTFHPSTEHWPSWSPDGTRVVFDSTRGGGSHDLYIKRVSGGEEEQLLFKSDQSKGVEDWSPDGKTVLFNSDAPDTGFDLWYMSVDGDKAPKPFVMTPFLERFGQFSPDGKWVAYASTESGRTEVYVRPFPGPGGQWQISSSGGTAPRWNPNGRELFYVRLDSTFMAAPITFGPGGPEPGQPVALFQPAIVGSSTTRPQYDVSKDGRFLVNVIVDDALSRPVTMLLNWAANTP